MRPDETTKPQQEASGYLGDALTLRPTEQQPAAKARRRILEALAQAPPGVLRRNAIVRVAKVRRQAALAALRVLEAEGLLRWNQRSKTFRYVGPKLGDN
jgi:predicted transcriptional regulator